MSRVHGSPAFQSPGRSVRMAFLLLSFVTALYAETAPATESEARAGTVGPDVVVKLFGAGAGTLDSYGSGVLVSPEGEFLTVWNHLVHSGGLTVVLHDGRRFPVEVIGADADLDVALLKLDADEPLNLPYVDVQGAVIPQSGDRVFVFSNMYRVAAGNEPVSVMRATVAQVAPLQASRGRWQFPVREPVIVIDAVTNNSGAGGGLVTDTAGQPVGLLGRELRHRVTDTWVNYAVPLSLIAERLPALRRGETSGDWNSGVSGNVAALSDREVSRRYGLTFVPEVVENTPAYVDAVRLQSAASQAGLKRGDLILMVNQQVIRSGEQFRQEIAAYRSGQRFSVTAERDGQLTTVTIQVP